MKILMMCLGVSLSYLSFNLCAKPIEKPKLYDNRNILQLGYYAGRCSAIKSLYMAMDINTDSHALKLTNHLLQSVLKIDAKKLKMNVPKYSEFCNKTLGQFDLQYLLYKK